MVQVVIQPSYGSPAARHHWATTMGAEVQFSDPPYRDTLSDDAFDQLSTLHDGGQAHFWGATRNHDKRMASLQTGDIVLFTGQKKVRAVGEVGISLRNEGFANKMWSPDPDRGSFHNVYSLLNLQVVDVDYAEIWALPSFNTNDNFMGLRFLDADKSVEILEGLQIDPVVAAQHAAQAEVVIAEALYKGISLPAEAVNTANASYQKKAGQVLVHRAEALLVQDYIGTLDNVVTSRFKTPDGGIADLLVDGPDGVEVIEAKRSSSRTFVRHALGQLLDYAPSAPKQVDRIAALLPDKPAQSVIDMLHRYGADCIFRAAPGSYVRLAAANDVRDHLKQRWAL